MKNILILLIIIITCNTLTMGQVYTDSLRNQKFFYDLKDSNDLKISELPLIFNTNISDSVYINRLMSMPFEFNMTYNPTVKRFIEFYTVKNKTKLEAIIGRSDFFFPIIEQVLKTYNLPDELKYLPIIESAFNTKAVSPAHAAGIWQFMKGTGKENGLTVNSLVDQRKGYLESTIAAAKYLTTLFSIYHDWQLVLAAYNCGPGNVNRAIHRSGGKHSFWEISKYLPRETRTYVPSYIGAAYAVYYYKEHNIHPLTASFPEKTDTILINKQLHLNQVSNILGIDINMLRLINPQYVKDLIPGTDKTNYSLNLPKENKAQFIELQDSIYSYKKDFYKNESLHQNLSNRRYMSGSVTRIIHRVHSGESISMIAGEYNVSIKSIKGWNNISGNKIWKGQKLVVYAAE